jgi:hypothetical protein
LTYFRRIATRQARTLHRSAGNGKVFRKAGAAAGRPKDRQKTQKERPMSVIPFDLRDGYIWLDGKLVEWKEAKLHVLSHGLHYGSSVFEGERAYNGKIFKTIWLF